MRAPDRDTQGDLDGGTLDFFEEWVAENAAQRNASADEIIDQMVSSYRILDELTGMVSQSRPQATGPSERSPEAEDTQQRATEHTADESGPPTDRGVSDLLASLVDSPGQVEPGSDRETALNSETMQLAIRALLKRGDHVIESRRERYQLSNRISDLEGGLETIETTVEQELPQNEPQELEERLVELSQRLSGIEEAFAEYKPRIEERADHVDRRLAEHRDRLVRLRRSVDELADRIDESNEEVRRIIDEPEARRRLADIKTAANQRGARTADCDACDTPVTIALLAEPACPHCQRPFDGITTRSWLWRTTTVLTTRSEFVFGR